MRKNLTISYTHEFGRAGDEDGSWMEIGRRSYSLNRDPQSGVFNISVDFSTYYSDWPASDLDERINYAMPAGWVPNEQLIESLTSGEHKKTKLYNSWQELMKLQEPWLELLKTLCDFESFSSLRRNTWSRHKSESTTTNSLIVENGNLKYLDEYLSEDIQAKTRRTEKIELSEGKLRDWPESFNGEFHALMRGNYDPDRYMYESDDGYYYDGPSDEEIQREIQGLSLQKSNDLYHDLVSGLRLHLKTGLEGARQEWFFPEGDFWMHIRMLAKIESESA
jgi:hypothetical protein